MGEETRRISADPLAVHAPGEAALNPYAYVHGKVLVAVDPVGLCDSDTQSCTEQYTYTTETGEAGDYHNEVRDVPDVKADTVDQGSGEPRTDVVILDQGFKRRVIPKADYQALQLQGRFQTS